MRNIATFFGILFASCSFSENLVLPENIISALPSGCNQVKDFFTVFPYIRKPPYVYDLFALDPLSEHGSKALVIRNWNSFAAWCEKPTNDNNKEYYLYVNSGDKEDFTCPELIGPFEIDDIGGLSIEYNVQEPLGWYIYQNDRSKYGDMEALTKGNILVSNYDGMGINFYCNNGKWMLRDFH